MQKALSLIFFKNFVHLWVIPISPVHSQIISWQHFHITDPQPTFYMTLINKTQWHWVIISSHHSISLSIHLFIQLSIYSFYYPSKSGFKIDQIRQESLSTLNLLLSIINKHSSSISTLNLRLQISNEWSKRIQLSARVQWGWWGVSHEVTRPFHSVLPHTL